MNTKAAGLKPAAFFFCQENIGKLNHLILAQLFGCFETLPAHSQVFETSSLNPDHECTPRETDRVDIETAGVKPEAFVDVCWSW